MALVARLGATAPNATVQPGTVRVVATTALKLEANALVHVLCREEVSKLRGVGNLLKRPDSIFVFLLSGSVASLAFAPASAFPFRCGRGRCRRRWKRQLFSVRTSWPSVQTTCQADQLQPLHHPVLLTPVRVPPCCTDSNRRLAALFVGFSSEFKLIRQAVLPAGCCEELSFQFLLQTEILLAEQLFQDS